MGRHLIISHFDHLLTAHQTFMIVEFQNMYAILTLTTIIYSFTTRFNLPSGDMNETSQASI